MCVEKLDHKTCCCHTQVVVFEKLEYNGHNLALLYYYAIRSTRL